MKKLSKLFLLLMLICAAFPVQAQVLEDGRRMDVTIPKILVPGQPFPVKVKVTNVSMSQAVSILRWTGGVFLAPQGFTFLNMGANSSAGTYGYQTYDNPLVSQIHFGPDPAHDIDDFPVGASVTYIINIQPPLSVKDFGIFIILEEIGAPQLLSYTLQMGVPQQTVISAGLFVCSGNGREVTHCNEKTGRAMAVLYTPNLGVVEGIAVGPDNNLYVADNETSRIFRFTPTGSGTVFCSNPINKPGGIAFGPDRNLYVTTGGGAIGTGAVRFNGVTGAVMDNGKLFTKGVPAGAIPHGVAFGPGGDLFMSDLAHGQILRFDGKTGQFRGPIISGLNGPVGLAFGPDGLLYVPCYYAGIVKRFRADTGAFDEDVCSVPSCHSLAFGPDGNLYITSPGTNSVFQYDFDTEELTPFAVNPPGQPFLNAPSYLVFFDPAHTHKK